MKKKNKGFTLIELLVVIAIIGLLSSIVLASLNTARKKARDSKRIADLKQLQTALEMYFDANGGLYPTSLNSLVTSGYIPVIPTPPAGALQTNYAYAALGNGTNCISYHLGASMEQDENANSLLKTDVDAPNGTICTNGGNEFHGNALNCSGTSAASIDNCYDLKP